MGLIASIFTHFLFLSLPADIEWTLVGLKRPANGHVIVISTIPIKNQKSIAEIARTGFTPWNIRAYFE